MKNYKQIRYSAMKITKAKNRLLKRFNLLVFLCLMIPFTAIAIESSNTLQDKFDTGVSMMTMAVIGSIDSVSDKETAPNQISARVWLLDVDEQADLTQNFPKNKVTREVSTIPLLANQFWHYFTAIDDTLEDSSSGEKGDITTTVTNTFGFIMGGNNKKLLGFLEDKAGKRFIVVFQVLWDENYYIHGSFVKPMVLKNFERKNGKEGRYVNFTFENKAFEMPYQYVGNLTVEAAQAIATDATDLVIGMKQQYETPNDNAGATILATISGVTADDYGRYIDVIGGGGANATTIADNGVFVLIDGTLWTGNDGSKITFQILDSESLIEVPGSRVQT